MDINNQKIAIICNYHLLSERVGGMDYFFWEFDKKCKENNIQIETNSMAGLDIVL